MEADEVKEAVRSYLFLSIRLERSCWDYSDKQLKWIAYGFF
jgi:hypothetical protein